MVGKERTIVNSYAREASTASMNDMRGETRLSRRRRLVGIQNRLEYRWAM